MERVRVARSAIQAVSAHPPLSVVCPRLRSMANPKGLAEEVAEEASEGEGPDLQYVRQRCSRSLVKKKVKKKGNTPLLVESAPLLVESARKIPATKVGGRLPYFDGLCGRLRILTTTAPMTLACLCLLRWLYL